jgi:hypothetical protein
VRQKFRRSFQASKENIQNFKTNYSFTFSSLFAHQDPDPDPADQIQCGSGSMILVSKSRFYPPVCLLTRRREGPCMNIATVCFLGLLK